MIVVQHNLMKLKKGMKDENNFYKTRFNVERVWIRTDFLDRTLN